MELVKPSIGLIFWMAVSFSIILFLLKKFAWKPILGMIKEREQSIENALAAAENAKEEMKALQSNNERILVEARAERDQLLKDAREIREKMIADAKGLATKEGERLLTIARDNIQNEKMLNLKKDSDLKFRIQELRLYSRERFFTEAIEILILLFKNKKTARD